MKVEGKSLQIRFNGATVGLSTDCSVEDALEVYDARTKDDVGAADVAGEITHSITTDALLGLNPGATQQTYATLKELFHRRALVLVEVMLAAGAREALSAPDWAPGPVEAKGFRGYAGNAIIRSLRLTGSLAGKAKISIQLAVQGEMYPVDTYFSSDVQGTQLLLGGSAEVTKARALYIEAPSAIVRGNTLVLSEPVPEPTNS